MLGADLKYESSCEEIASSCDEIEIHMSKSSQVLAKNKKSRVDLSSVVLCVVLF